MTDSISWQDRKNTQQALLLVEEYAAPTPENLEWPLVLGYIQAARLSAEAGQTFDAVRRLEIARDKSEGLGKIAALRALSEIVEAQPDLEKALVFEKQALSTGTQWFKRRRISESAGLEPAKEGVAIWEKLKPVIEARIEDLERRVDIDRYGLDYVLYRQAQTLRRSNHPAALDFTDITAAFRMRNTSMLPSIPGADFEAARAQYVEITELFPEGVYTEASKLYAAVCLVHLGDARGAMRELTAFYKQNPDGLYRGEALLLLGDLYLVGQWDQANAKEAYARASAWAASVGERQRILETYTVPEKSAKVSKPPEQPRSLNRYGQIEKRSLEPGILVNRLTADWYLPRLRAQAEWKLGFLAVVADEPDAAKRHFDQALEQDRLLRQAVGMKVFNAYDRLLMSLENKVFTGTEEDMEGLRGTVRLAMHWADFNFMLENFDLAKDLYHRIQRAAREEKDGAALIRATVGDVLVRKAEEDPDIGSDTLRLYALAMEYPRAPATPYLLWHCAMITEGNPMRWPEFFDLIIKEYPRSHHALEARYNQVLRRHPWKHHDLRRAMIEEFKRDYPNEKEYHRHLDGWDKSVTEFMESPARREAVEEK
ncbi:MAG: hypothetical protein WD708_06970 [Kiritimatiellia bacterium]